MADQPAGTGQGGRPARAPRRITADYLQRAALHYLERYSAPAGQLSCRHHGEDPARHTDALEAIIARCVATGLVDDRRFAEARAATLRRKGQSSRAVAARLAAKGVPRDLAGELAVAEAGAEKAAALVAARRRRLGPWREAGQRAACRQKDLTALARLGFDFATARAVIDGDPEGEA